MDLENQHLELKEVQRIKVHTGSVWCLAWKPTAGVDGVPAVLASCGDNQSVRLWEYNPDMLIFQRKAVLKEGDKDHKPITFCSWSPSGKFLATASDGCTVTIWKEHDDGVNFVRICAQNYESEITSVAWSFCGTFLATCGQEVTIWNVAVLKPSEMKKPCVLNKTKEVVMLKWHPLFNSLFTCHYHHIKVWEMDSGIWQNDFTLTEPSSKSGRKYLISALFFNTTGNKMLTCSDTINIWCRDITNEEYKHTGYWKLLFTLPKYHYTNIFSVHWSREGIISCGTGDEDSAIGVFVENEDGLIDNEAEEEVRGPAYRLLLERKKAHDIAVSVVQWSPTENRRLASASLDGTIKIWDLVTQN